MPDPRSPKPSPLKAALGRDWLSPSMRRFWTGIASLIALRRRYPELTDGRLDDVGVEFDEDQRWLAFSRGRVTVAFNLASTRRDRGGGQTIELASDDRGAHRRRQPVAAARLGRDRRRPDDPAIRLYATDVAEDGTVRLMPVKIRAQADV